jgi:hypothetical protein
VRGGQPQLRGLLVHARDEPSRPVRRDAGQHARGRVVGGNQGEVQQVRQRELVARADVGGGRIAHIGALHDHFTRQVRRVLEEDNGGHHLRDAGDGTRVLRVLLPEHLAGKGVVNDGGFRPQIRHELALVIELEPRLFRFFLRPRRRGRPGARRRAATRRCRHRLLFCGRGSSLRRYGCRLLGKGKRRLSLTGAPGDRCLCTNYRRHAEHGECTDQLGPEQPGLDHGQPLEFELVTDCVGIVANKL